MYEVLTIDPDDSDKFTEASEQSWETASVRVHDVEQIETALP